MFQLCSLIYNSSSDGVVPRLSVVIPTYQGAQILKFTLESLVRQQVSCPWEILICDDGSDDLQPSMFQDIPQVIRVYQFHTRVGYPGNLQRCIDLSQGELIMLLGQDDIVASGYLQCVVDMFLSSPNIGAISRSYYWFEDTPDVPVRAKRIPRGLREKRFVDITINSSMAEIKILLDSLDQLSGVAFRRSALQSGIGGEIFTAHIQPFIDILLCQPVRFICSTPIAVRIRSSQSRNVSSIYSHSPLSSWISVANSFPTMRLRNWISKEFVCRNYVGLLQIRNYSDQPIRYVLREMELMIRHRPMNLLSIRFWLIAALCMALPRQLLASLTDFCKPLSLYGRPKPTLESR